MGLLKSILTKFYLSKVVSFTYLLAIDLFKIDTYNKDGYGWNVNNFVYYVGTFVLCSEHSCGLRANTSFNVIGSRDFCWFVVSADIL